MVEADRECVRQGVARQQKVQHSIQPNGKQPLQHNQQQQQDAQSNGQQTHQQELLGQQEQRKQAQRFNQEQQQQQQQQQGFVAAPPMNAIKSMPGWATARGHSICHSCSGSKTSDPSRSCSSRVAAVLPRLPSCSVSKSGSRTAVDSPPGALPCSSGARVSKPDTKR
jgi:hypothetical protein